MNTQTQAATPTQPSINSMSTWEIDPAHSSANFSVRHMMIAKVHGGFTKLTGSLSLNRNDPSKSVVEAIIDAGSIDTREPKRDEHLQSADFFDVEKYPSITFKSRKVKQEGDGRPPSWSHS